MELLEYLHILKKRLWIILTATIVLALTAAILSTFVLHPVYEGKVTLIIGRANNTDSDKIRYDDILMYQKLVKTYSELVKSRLVIDETISRLGYDITYRNMEKKLKVTPKGDTQILEIAVEDHSPEKAMQLTNMLSEVFIEKIKTMMNSDNVKIMDKAQMPDKPVKPRILLNIVIAAFLGFISSLGLIFLIENLDNTIKTEEDIEKHLSAAILASIPYIRAPRNKNNIIEMITLKDPKSPVSEVYRTLWTNIKFISFQKHMKSIIFTSTGPSEGKSTVISNLGIIMAQSGNKVLLLEGDLRKPSLHKNFSLQNSIGITNILVEDALHTDCITHTNIKNLDLLLCGPKPPNPAELLGSEAMKNLIEYLQNDYDYILIDTPPVIVVTDAALLVSICHGAILLVSSGETIIEGAIKAKELLNNVKADLLGVVLNKVKIDKQKGYYSYYRYYYDKLDGVKKDIR